MAIRRKILLVPSPRGMRLQRPPAVAPGAAWREYPGQGWQTYAAGTEVHTGSARTVKGSPALQTTPNSSKSSALPAAHGKPAAPTASGGGVDDEDDF